MKIKKSVYSKIMSQYKMSQIRQRKTDITLAVTDIVG